MSSRGGEKTTRRERIWGRNNDIAQYAHEPDLTASPKPLLATDRVRGSSGAPKSAKSIHTGKANGPGPSAVYHKKPLRADEHVQCALDQIASPSGHEALLLNIKMNNMPFLLIVKMKYVDKVSGSSSAMLSAVLVSKFN